MAGLSISLISADFPPTRNKVRNGYTPNDDDSFKSCMFCGFKHGWFQAIPSKRYADMRQVGLRILPRFRAAKLLKFPYFAAI